MRTAAYIFKKQQCFLITINILRTFSNESFAYKKFEISFWGKDLRYWWPKNHHSQKCSLVEPQHVSFIGFQYLECNDCIYISRLYLESETLYSILLAFGKKGSSHVFSAKIHVRTTVETTPSHMGPSHPTYLLLLIYVIRTFDVKLTCL